MEHNELKLNKDDSEESQEEEEEEEEEEEDVEDEEEPKLKYQRLGSNVIEILRRDAASCMALHEKFLCLGTHWGVVYILDINGNEIRRYPCHSATIHELSIDASGEYIASCSDDGKVCIHGLYTDEAFEYEYHRPVISVAIDPEFSKKQSKAFACGGLAGQLIINSKGWFGRKDNLLHSGEGPIQTIKWKGSLIAWSNDYGVKIYDCNTAQRISYIDRPKGSPRADLYKCNLCWENDYTLIIGWADCVKIGQIKEKEKEIKDKDLSKNSLPDRYVEITGMFQTEYFISGIAPFGEYLVVLAYSESRSDDQPQISDNNNKQKMQAQRPELRIITRSNEEVSSDALSIHGFEHYVSNNYKLGYMPQESLFYIVSPRDIVVARPRDLDDHISWLIERRRYEEALQAAEANEAQLKDHKLSAIGEMYIEYLMSIGEFGNCAEVCPKILKRDAALWKKWIFKFAEYNQLRYICDYIPVGNPDLGSSLYEMVLGYFLSSNDPKDHKKFLELIEEWPSSLYTINNVIALLKKRLKEISNDPLMDALAKLYTFDKQFDKTLHIYLRLKRGNPFELIEKYNLFDSIRDKVALLMQYDKDKAVQMLINNIDRISIEQVVSQLKDEPRLLHEYLHNLFVKDAHAGKDYHELQVTMYADYDYKYLSSFLRQSNYYPLEKAYKVCQDRNLYPEMVFILGRMGNNKQGLQLLIEKIGDVKQAIEFIEGQNDEELWDDLIDYSMKNPQFVSGLLEHIGAYVDPIKLIKRIPTGMEITALRDRLVKIISDYNLQMSLREGCKEVLKADCVDLAERLYRAQRKGFKTEQSAKCAICENPVTNINLDVKNPSNGIVVFFCHHIYHQSCLRTGTPEDGTADKKVSNANDSDRLWCTICRQNQSKPKKSMRATGSQSAFVRG